MVYWQKIAEFAALIWLSAARAYGGVGGGPLTRNLPQPRDDRALETVTRGAVAAIHVKGKVLYLASDPPVAGQAQFDAAGTTREQVFGKLADQQKAVLGPGAAGAVFSGVDALAERLLYFDGAALALIEAEPKTLMPLVRRTLAWDLLKPPRDRGGEPTAPETAALRAAFKRQLLATSNELDAPRFTGMAALPAAWTPVKKRQYLVASRIRGFPLLLLECGTEEPSQCQISRQCYLEGSDIASAAVTGIAISAARRLVVIGDAERRRLVAFKYHSCYHVSRRLQLMLPERLKRLTNLSIDADDRLWVSTGTPDDYQNASVFAWDKSDW